jgi:hypothetical protein
MSTTVTSATWVEQELFYYCGPAVAKMMLQSVGVVAVTQDELFTDIKTASRGTPHAGSGRLPGFTRQHCLVCQTIWRCWYSAPAAMQKAINKRMPGQALTLLKTAPLHKKTAVARMVQSVNAGVAPAFLTNGDHWRLVWAYEFGNGLAQFPTQLFAGIDVAGFYVHDPNPALAGQSLTLQSVPSFLADFAVVDCGPSSTSGKHVAIVA